MTSAKVKITTTKKFEKLRSKFSKANKEDLLVEIYELQKQNSTNEKLLETLRHELISYQSALNEVNTKDQLGKNKRAEGRGRLFKENEELLKKSLSVFEDFLDRPFQSKDFIKFQRFVVSAFPSPAFIPTPRLKLSEKRLSAEEQAEILEVKKRTGWSTSQLRSFFEKSTGVKPTTKKNSLVKS